MALRKNESHVQPDVRALYASAHRLLSNGQPRDASVLFRLMLHIAPTDERAWLGLGACHEQISQLDVAGKLYAMGRTASGSIRCLVAAARVCAKQGFDDQAEEIYDTAIEEATDAEHIQLATIARAEKEQIHVY